MIKKIRSLLSCPGLWIQLLPLVIMFALLWITAWKPFHLSFDTIKFWEYLVYGWVYAAVTYLLGLVIVAKFLRKWWLAAAFSWFFLLLYAVNAGFIYHMGAMLSPYFIWVARPTAGMIYFWDYFTRWIFLLTVFFLLSGWVSAWLIRRHVRALSATPLRWLLLLSVLCWIAPILRELGIFRPSAVAASALKANLQGAWRLDQTYDLRNLARNPVIIFGRALFNHRLRPLEPHPVSDLALVSDALKEWHLPLGPRHYPPLGLKPFNHIIMFGTESLSLDLLAPYNPGLPGDLTPFYGSPEVTNRMFLNYQCVALPTQPGLSVTFNSHPNFGGLLTGNCEESLIKYLDAEGYETYFLMSGPDTFMDDDKIFMKMGFKHVLGSQTWMKNPELNPFIEGRGLMDQKLYGQVLECMETNRGKKIFIQIMNCDTHSPEPRDVYGSLAYPPYPASLSKFNDDAEVKAILSGIFRHDYDVGQTIKKMRERNLLGEDTLVILTADHNYPHAEALNRIPDYPVASHSRLPLAFLSGQPLPQADLQQIHSQLDFAPTILHLMGMPIPEGWWGESIFAPHQNAPVVEKRDRNLVVTPLDGGPQQTIAMDYPRNAAEKELIELFDNVYTNALPAPAASVVSPTP